MIAVEKTARWAFAALLASSAAVWVWRVVSQILDLGF
jgi:hypothetical protein